MTASIFASGTVAKSVPFGKYCRISPFVYSFVPRSPEAYGWAKYTSISKACARSSWAANLRPLSSVSVNMCIFQVASKAMSASLVTAAVRWATFLISAERDRRSTKVTNAALLLPLTTVSPSQSPSQRRWATTSGRTIIRWRLRIWPRRSRVPYHFRRFF